MKSHRRLAPLALLAALGLLAAACGQKPGVAAKGVPAGAFGGNVAVDPETGQLIDPETGEIIDPETGEPVSGSGSTTTTTGGGDTGGSTGGGGDTGGSTGGGDTGGSTGGEPSGGDATGVSGTTIKIGSHAPLTGAAPVPSDAAQKGSTIYWDWLKSQNKDVNGRNVEAILRNDNYNPSQAVSVCKEMVEKDKVFLLSGLAGTDQIQACARYAASVGVPYMSAGVTEIGLTGLPNYFAVSMTYPDQGPLLADFLVSKLGAKGEKNGMLRFQTPNFEDAHDAFIKAMSDKGAAVAYDRAVSKNSDARTAQTVVREMQAAGIENVYVLTSPVWFLQVLNAAGTQGYRPQWVGVGITMTFDTVANLGCRNSNGGFGNPAAKFFAPFPAYSESARYDPNFRQALGSVGEDQADGDRDNDFIWLGWAASKGLHQMLELPGKDLTRERFIYKLERARNLRNGINPPLSYTPDDHFGANQVHVSQADCGDGRWHTIQDFVSDF